MTIIEKEQSKHPKHANVQVQDGLIYTQSGQIWLPQEANDLPLRLLVIDHTSARGHRGQSATISAFPNRFSWDTLETDSKIFVSSCIHYLSTTGGEKVPRPVGPAMFGTKPNNLLQFDYLDLANSSNGDR